MDAKMTRVSPAYRKPLRMPNKVPRMSKKGLATALAVLFAVIPNSKSRPVSQSGSCYDRRWTGRLIGPASLQVSHCIRPAVPATVAEELDPEPKSS